VESTLLFFQPPEFFVCVCVCVCVSARTHTLMEIFCVALSTLLYEQHSLSRLLHSLIESNLIPWIRSVRVIDHFLYFVHCSVLTFWGMQMSAQYIFVEWMNGIVLLYIKDNIKESSSLRQLSRSPESTSDRQVSTDSSFCSSVWTANGQWQEGEFQSHRHPVTKKNHSQKEALSPIPGERNTENSYDFSHLHKEKCFYFVRILSF